MPVRTAWFGTWGRLRFLIQQGFWDTLGCFWHQEGIGSPRCFPSCSPVCSVPCQHGDAGLWGRNEAASSPAALSSAPLREATFPGSASL